MEFVQIDVFCDGPYTGNPLAVFPDAAELETSQMQRIALEMNLSETTFVTSSDPGGYDVRIFTPREELPFAGHPTIGTAWVLSKRGIFDGSEIVQRSPVGETHVTSEGDRWWLEREGASEPDIETSDAAAVQRIAAAFGLGESDIGHETSDLGAPAVLRPAFSSAGFRQLMVPVTGIDALGRCRANPELLSEFEGGAYCFTVTGEAHIRARGIFPGVGVPEDPATGSAAAALGLYLADRVGATDAEIEQGIEMGRPSRIFLHAEDKTVRVGGRCAHVFDGQLRAFP
jgi:trans-2,3-dihydro-3-hydroxyanthranilate isomerase